MGYATGRRGPHRLCKGSHWSGRCCPWPGCTSQRLELMPWKVGPSRLAAGADAAALGRGPPVQLADREGAGVERSRPSCPRRTLSEMASSSAVRRLWSAGRQPCSAAAAPSRGGGASLVVLGQYGLPTGAGLSEKEGAVHAGGCVVGRAHVGKRSAPGMPVQCGALCCTTARWHFLVCWFEC